jgi:signal transduction histidine kinase
MESLTAAGIVLLAVACVLFAALLVRSRRPWGRDRNGADRVGELLALREAALDISGELDLDAVLQRVVDRARQLSDARYGALAVYGPDGAIERFLTSGISAEMRRRIGPEPVGRGLLGEVVGGQSLRLRDLRTHPAAVGFPSEHPTMTSLLAVPIRGRAPWRGNLYVTDKNGADEFDAGDEEMLRRFADQSALAIDSAWLHRRVRELAVAEERQRIAHEMHDGLAQVLASVITGTQAAREYLRSGRVDEAVAQLEQLRSAANTTYTETREGILALRAAGDSELPAERILEDYLAEWQDRTGIEARWTHADGAAIPASAELQVVRIAQEALANVRRHSGAARVTVSLERDGGELRLTVADDGRGFDAAALPRAAAPRFGLATMRERAQAIGGRLEIRSAPGRGTVVELRLPIAEEPPAGEIAK